MEDKTRRYFGRARDDIASVGRERDATRTIKYPRKCIGFKIVVRTVVHLFYSLHSVLVEIVSRYVARIRTSYCEFSGENDIIIWRTSGNANDSERNEEKRFVLCKMEAGIVMTVIARVAFSPSR